MVEVVLMHGGCGQIRKATCQRQPRCKTEVDKIKQGDQSRPDKYPCCILMNFKIDQNPIEGKNDNDGSLHDSDLTIEPQVSDDIRMEFLSQLIGENIKPAHINQQMWKGADDNGCNGISPSGDGHQHEN